MLKAQVICRLPGTTSAWHRFSRPEAVITAMDTASVAPALAKIETAVKQGKYAAGFISYEAAPAFDPAFQTYPADGFPLLWFGIFPSPGEELSGFPTSGTATPTPTPRITRECYTATLDRIRQHIAAGDIYQANFTIRTGLRLDGQSPEDLFFDWCARHPVPYAAYVDTGELQLISVSPELFLSKDGNRLCSIPMKGTAPRQLTAEADRQAARQLAADTKNRAENLMIVDMVRNDFGRVCVPGSITVDPLFQVSTYRTVHQMTSTVHGLVPADASFADILAATFPAASITGAPKIRAMEIINQTETSPRQAYTGSIGCLAPDGDFLFNVAIRTVICRDGDGELSVGGGIVADSEPESEWQEALSKSKFCTAPPLPGFRLIETMLHTRDNGFPMLAEHLDRAEASQRYFGRPFDRQQLESYLSALKIPHEYARVRLTLDEQGQPDITVFPLPMPGWGKECLTVAIAPEQTDSREVFLYHKTTLRERYNRLFLRAQENGWDEMIFTNERGELTEGCISNLFLKINGTWLTPALSCGLLPGLWRQKTIAELHAREAILTLDDLAAAQNIMLGNAVRGGTQAKIKQFSRL